MSGQPDSRPPLGGVPPPSAEDRAYILRENRIWNELMKLPKGMLQAMYLSMGQGPLKGDSKSDLARFLSKYLMKWDFMRTPEER